MIHTGDCVAIMAGMEPDRFDAIVTDPPYDLLTTSRNGSRRINNPDNPAGRSAKGFMGKTWDGTGVAFDPATWREALRVAKPGAHLLAFGGTRTYHRLTCALEDAGWEIRDCLVWAYASGFPKSLDVSKAIDKAAGEWRGRAGAVTVAVQPSKGTEYERTPKGDPITAEAVRWAGWGTALKPAWEPIVLARKPLAGTVAANVERWGTGAINVDAARIPFRDPLDAAAAAVGYATSMEQGTMSEPTSLPTVYDKPPYEPEKLNGRWPPNLLLTDAELFDVRNDGVVGSGAVREPPGGPGRQATYPGGEVVNFTGDHEQGPLYFDTGGYARFFLVPKASRSDREPVWGEELDVGEDVGVRYTTMAGDGRPEPAVKPVRRRNTHPTVKPVDLMRHLVRLVTPPGGVILDPFLGSGSTAIAAIMEGFSCVGIERDPEYVRIAQARLDGVQTGAGL